ncbi:MAG: ATP F0F1 synthase subunit I [Rhizobiaceae bacterium]|nr:MAG: ATP F0F1 synthase subunit I [Rhizobiaceae bacterium]CAG1015537.1 ATP synthase protein I [Rhizobiaceae bacterium]
MARSDRPDETGKTGPGETERPEFRDDDLERRRRALEASLAARAPGGRDGDEGAKPGGTTGYGQALKLSSEFIAGVAVGAGLGWVVDRLAGSSPWGLIVFLLLGFGAGVLNVMRSAGLVAEPGLRKPGRDGGRNGN